MAVRRLPGREAGPLGAHPLPWVLELAASRDVDSTAFGFDHPGKKAVLVPLSTNQSEGATAPPPAKAAREAEPVEGAQAEAKKARLQ